MAELKTKPTGESVEAFLNGIADVQRRQDCFTVLEMMRRATQAAPTMWGSAIVGLGSSHYTYASGRSSEWFAAGFSPRKQNLTLYLLSGFEQYDELLERLGKYSTGKACLYIKRLADVDLAVLEELITRSVELTRRTAA
jgi:hypothetical protein